MTIERLLTDEVEASEMGMSLLNYAFNERSLSLIPFARARRINPEDIELLAISDIPNYLSDCCYIAVIALKTRQDKIDGFFEACWENKNGNYWKELHILDSMGECSSKILEELK